MSDEGKKKTSYDGMDDSQVKKAVEESVKEAAALTQGDGKGVLRSATDKAAELYALAKEKSPDAVKSGIAKVEEKTAGLTAKVGGAANPLIDDLDGRLDGLSLKVKEIYKLTPQDYLKYVQVKGNEWKSWGTELLHFDLIAYCKSITVKATDTAASSAKPVTDPLQAKLATAVEELSKARTALDTAVKARSAQTKEQIAAAQAELTTKINAAMAEATKLSASGVAFVESKKDSLPVPAQKSVDFIMASPAKIKTVSEEVKAKADLDSAKGTLENVNNLLLAVKEVVYANVVQTASKTEAAPAADEAKAE